MSIGTELVLLLYLFVKAWALGRDESSSLVGGIAYVVAISAIIVFMVLIVYTIGSVFMAVCGGDVL